MMEGGRAASIQQENEALRAQNTAQAETIRRLEHQIAVFEQEARRLHEGAVAAGTSLRPALVAGDPTEAALVLAKIAEYESTRAFFAEQQIDTAHVVADLARLRSHLTAIGGAEEGVPPGSDSTELGRSTSVKISELLEVSRATARRVLDHAEGDVNLAITNLLTNVLNPQISPLLALATSPALGSLGGLSHQDAAALLAGEDGDIGRAEARLAGALGQAAQAATSEPIASGEKLSRALSLALITPPGESFQCQICFESPSSSEGVALRGCGHVWCAICLRGVVSAAMEEGQAVATCPGLDCSSEISQRELRALIGVASFSTMDRRGLEQTAALDPTLHLCPSADCSFITCWAGTEDGEPKLDCPLCKSSHCLVCGSSPYHEGQGCPTPGQQGQLVDPDAVRLAAEEEASAAFLQGGSADIKMCARCAMPVMKAHGCYKMKCRCGYRFCFNCLSENAQCGCTPASHGFIDNTTGRGDFRNLRNQTSPT